MFEQLEQMSIDQKAKADVQRQKDDRPELPFVDLIDTASVSHHLT
jgi:hypothetical protein